jgi:tetratricopeptide (TPR) repeat protein
MLAEKIAQARQAKRQRIIRFAIVTCGVALLAALLLYFSSHYSLSKKENAVPETSETEPASSPEPGSTATERVTNEDERQSYLDGYAHYQNQLKPELDAIDIKRWDKTLADRLALTEKEALDAFAAGDYARANQSMQALTTLAQQTIDNSRQAFTEAMQNAKTAYADLDYNRARLEVDKALMHDADNEQAQDLSERVEQIPQIASLEKAMAVARAENNTARELELINSLLQLDADRPALKQRATGLQTQMASNRYQQHIANGYSAIEQGQLQTAKTQLSQARKISPSGPETKQMAQAIAELESDLIYETSVTAATQAQQADDWAEASTHWQKALEQRPANKQLSEKLATAERIVSLKQQMQDLLAKPYRLTNELVKSKADIALIQSEAVINDSPSLRSTADKLRQTLNAVNTPVTVEVISDGETAVSVRGVGVVGTTRSKIIELKPGPYRFEGKRQGYKSKIIEVTIPFDTPSYQVSIVADERI